MGFYSVTDRPTDGPWFCVGVMGHESNSQKNVPWNILNVGRYFVGID